MKEMGKMNNAIVQIICGIIIFVSILYYLKVMPDYRQTDRGNRVLSAASQLTFSSYMIGFALILIVISIQGMSTRNFIQSCLLHATIVSVVNAGSIIFYNIKLPKN